jgi:YegS/Rv2252/BmrU family lipid kinase
MHSRREANQNAMQTNLERKLKTFAVINPVAGPREGETVQEIVERTVRDRESDCEIYLTREGDDVREVVEEALRKGARTILAAGGDGTVSAAASALIDKEAALAIIPSGTWNSLARNLDIPLDIGQAVDLALGEHDIRVIDMLEVEDKFFSLNVSVGIASMVLNTVEREEVRKLGRLTYLYKGAMQFLGRPPFRFWVTTNGRTTTFRANELIVANCGVMGIKNLRLDPDIHMDDGKFNLCRIRAKTFWDYLALGFSMAAGQQKKDPRVNCWEGGSEVRIESNERLPVQGDGEVLGYLPVTVRLRPRALSVIIPPKASQ